MNGWLPDSDGTYHLFKDGVLQVNARQPGILRNLRIKRVALVDEGANLDASTGDGAHILLYKSKVGVGKGGPSVADVHVDSPEWDIEDQDEVEKDTLSGEGRRSLPDSAFAAVWTDAQGKKHRKLPIHDAGHLTAARGRIDGADIPADVKDKARARINSKTHPPHSTAKESSMKTIKEIMKSVMDTILEPDIEKRKLALAPLSKAVDELEDPPTTVVKVAHTPGDPLCKCDTCMAKAADLKKKKDDDDAAELAKQVPAEVAKRMESISKQNEDLVKANTAMAATVAKMQDDQATVEMTTILKGFKHTPFKLTGDDSDVAKFKKMKAADPGGWERMLEIFKAQDAQMGTAFANVGSNLSGGRGNAWEQIEAKADAMMEKSTTSITREQAIEKVMFANPKLVKEYREQQQ